MCANYAQFPRDLVSSFRAIMALATRHPLLAADLLQQIRQAARAQGIQADTADKLTVILVFADAQAVSSFLAHAQSHGRMDPKAQHALKSPTDRVSRRRICDLVRSGT